MKLNGMIKQLCLYPYEEVHKVFCALMQAADEKDLEALIWCARRLDWFYDQGDLILGDLSPEQQNGIQAYQGSMEPPPLLIARISAKNNF